MLRSPKNIGNIVAIREKEYDSPSACHSEAVSLVYATDILARKGGNTRHKILETVKMKSDVLLLYL